MTVNSSASDASGTVKLEPGPVLTKVRVNRQCYPPPILENAGRVVPLVIIGSVRF